MNSQPSGMNNYGISAADRERRELVRRVSTRRLSGGSVLTGVSLDLELNDIDLDLRREYEVAVDCLVHCERIIKKLETGVLELETQVTSKDKALEKYDKKLSRKDDQIAALEEKMVQMSLELAKAQAAEDIIRSKRRTSAANTDESSLEDLDTSNPAMSSSDRDGMNKERNQLHQSRRRSSVQTNSAQGSMLSFFSSINDLPQPNAETLDVSIKSAPGFLEGASGLFGFFRRGNSRRVVSNGSCLGMNNRSLTNRESQSQYQGWDDPTTSPQVVPMTKDEEPQEQETHQPSYWGVAGNDRRNQNTSPAVVDGNTQPLNDTNNGISGNRRKTSTFRQQRGLKASSRSFLEGVVFPRDCDEVFDKGCKDLRVRV